MTTPTPGFLGTFNPAQFATLNAATYPGQHLIVDNGTTLDEYRSNGAGWIQAPVSGGGVLPAQLLTVTMGNSINAGLNNGTTRSNSAGADPLGWWSWGSDVFIANMLGGGIMRFGRITSTTQSDKWGQFSHSGNRLDQINAELEVQLYTPLVSAGLKPDLIVGHSLLENDIAQGGTFAQCVQRLQIWLLNAQGRYPTARIWLCTPRPSFSYNTPAIVAVYQQVTAYMLALDNGRDIFVSQMNGYENPASPGIPLTGYTDATVHPNIAGGWVNGRLSLLPTLRRIASAAFTTYRCTSGNFGQAGSTAATNTNVSGTCATGASHAGTANGTVALTANDPTVSIIYAQTAGQARDLSTYSAGTTAVTGFTQYSPYAKIKIDSGAEQLRMVALQPRFNDGATNVFMNMHQSSTSDSDPGALAGYQNGDVLTLRMPPVIQADVGSAGPWTSIGNFIRVERKTGGTANVLTSGAVGLTVLDVGVGLVA